MSRRVKLLIAVALAAFAASHLAAAYRLEAGAAKQTTDVISLQRD